MAFHVPASKASKGQDRFEFNIGADSFSVKKMNLVPIGTLERLDASGAEALDFFGGTTKKQQEAVRSLTRPQFTALVEAWRDESEVTPGESQASAS